MSYSYILEVQLKAQIFEWFIELKSVGGKVIMNISNGFKSYFPIQKQYSAIVYTVKVY